MSRYKQSLVKGILLMALMLFMPSWMWAEEEAWVEYAESTLTFHYDENRASCTATTYSLPAKGETPGWLEHMDDITKVVFCESFKDARPVRCAKWFYNMSKLTDIEGMQYLCTDSVNDMSYMFAFSSSIRALDLSHFNTASVTTMTNMFADCTLSSLDVSTFNTEKVDDMSYMFYNCNRLTTLNLDSFDTQIVTNMDDMFAHCRNLTRIDVSARFVLDRVTSSRYMFLFCDSLPNYETGRYDKEAAETYLNGPKMWVEFQKSTQTLTYRYDRGKDSTEATAKYDIPKAGEFPGWIYCHAKHAVLTTDFAYARPKSCAMWFYLLLDLTDISGLEYLNTSMVTDMRLMFAGCFSLPSVDLSHLNTDNVTSMEAMFYRCQALGDLDLSTFNTSNVTNMKRMFYECKELKALDLSSFNTEKVSKMESMFEACTSLQQLDLRSFNTQNVDTMARMFYDCNQLTALNLSSFNTEKVKDMSYMFAQCTSLPQLDLSSFCTSQVTTTRRMFYDCNQLKALNLSSFNTEKVKDMSYMFAQCSSLPQLDLSSFNASNADSTQYMFYDCNQLKALDLSSFNTEKVKDMSYMFAHCSSLPQLDLSSFCTAKVENMSYMFYDCKALQQLDLTSFNTERVTTMNSMFYDCNQLTELDLSSFNTANVNDMAYMFCMATDSAKLRRIYASYQFVTNNVSKDDKMFSGCTSLPYYTPKYVDKERAVWVEDKGHLTLRRTISVGDNIYNVDGYDPAICYADVAFSDDAAYSPTFSFFFADDATASYTRETDNHWITLCLPFSFSVDNTDASFYGVKSYDEGTIAVTKYRGIIAAGFPVLAYVTGGTLSISSKGATVVTDPQRYGVLQGTFTQTEVGDTAYIIANDHFWNAGWLKQNNKDVKHVYLAPYRASLTLTSTEAKPNSISIDLGETDGIDSIDTTDPSAFLDGAELYDLQGRRLSAPQRGVMIVRKGGVSRKVIVK